MQTETAPHVQTELLPHLYEEEYRELLAIANIMFAQTEPARLFENIADHLHVLYPIVSIGITYYNAATDTFDRGMIMTSERNIQQIEPIPHEGERLDGALKQRSAMILSSGTMEEDLRRFISLRDAVSGEQLSGVLLPLFGRDGRLLGVAAASSKASRPFTKDDLPFLNQLAVHIGLAVENAQLHQENRLLRLRLEQEGKYLKEEVDQAFNVGSLLFASGVIADVMRSVEKAAATDATVLLLGETGTGKELFARTIHAQSVFASRPLVKVNCGAIPSGLIESTLFGHEKGAFTGAVNRHIGMFEIADGGTLFLDEIAELPLEMQVKLLRVLQEGELTRVGGHELIRVNVRIIAATNRMLEKMVEEGHFRSDLYYRLAVIPITIPPLRERPEDIPLLATYFVQKFSQRFKKPMKQITSEAMKRLRAYAFPGNVRELENLIERAVVLCDARTLGVEYFPLKSSSTHHTSNLTTSHVGSLSERDAIIHALQSSNWMIEGERGAAKKLNIRPSTLRSRMMKLHIQRPK